MDLVLWLKLKVPRSSRPTIWLVDILLLVDTVLWLAELRVKRPSRTECRLSMSRPLQDPPTELGASCSKWRGQSALTRRPQLFSLSSSLPISFSSADPLGRTACEDIWEKAVTYYGADIKNSLWNWVILTFCSVETQPGLSLSWKKSQTQRDLKWQFPNFSEKPSMLLL